MKQNKPQWLIDAEAEINKFEQTKYGKYTDGQLSKSIAGSWAGRKNVESGHLDRISTFESRSNGGKTNVESGHLDRIRTSEVCAKGGSIGGKTSGKIWMQNAIESGLHKEASSSGGTSATGKVYTCSHCKKEVKGPSFFRYHEDNCKLKH
jgi:hypothetical protein